MNIAGIDYESIKDGEGVRTVIYVSGCSHNCYNCHNPQTHDVNYGIPFTEELQNEIIENIKKRPFLSGITWSGGDPLHENCLDDVLKFTNKIRLSMPEKTIWLYSGYKYEFIFRGEPSFLSEKGFNNYKRRKIIESVDVLVDGRYIDKQRDVTLAYRGSKNQRVIDAQQSLKNNEIVLYTT